MYNLYSELFGGYIQMKSTTSAKEMISMQHLAKQLHAVIKLYSYGLQLQLSGGGFMLLTVKLFYT